MSGTILQKLEAYVAIADSANDGIWNVNGASLAKQPEIVPKIVVYITCGIMTEISKTPKQSLTSLNPYQMSNGKLVYIEGSKETILKNDAPFALLQSMRSEMIRQGYKKEKLKIRYK